VELHELRRWFVSGDHYAAYLAVLDAGERYKWACDAEGEAREHFRDYCLRSLVRCFGYLKGAACSAGEVIPQDYHPDTIQEAAGRLLDAVRQLPSIGEVYLRFNVPRFRLEAGP
jgi:hypothetical protein